MQTAIKRMTGLHASLFGNLEARTDGWFIGLAARLWFAGILLRYYFKSAMT